MTKPQPGGTGGRAPGAFGLIPGGGAGIGQVTSSPILALRDRENRFLPSRCAGRAPARGVALLRLRSALYAGHERMNSERIAPVTKRQPAGTGRRSPGAFGLFRAVVRGSGG